MAQPQSYEEYIAQNEQPLFAKIMGWTILLSLPIGLGYAGYIMFGKKGR